MVERMNRTTKESTIKSYEYEGLVRLREHVQAFVQSYGFGKHLKALRWKTPFRTMCEAWRKNRAALDFIHTISLWGGTSKPSDPTVSNLAPQYRQPQQGRQDRQAGQPPG